METNPVYKTFAKTHKRHPAGMLLVSINVSSYQLMSPRLNDNLLFYHNSRIYVLWELLYLQEYAQSDQRICYAIHVRVELKI